MKRFILGKFLNEQKDSVVQIEGGIPLRNGGCYSLDGCYLVIDTKEETTFAITTNLKDAEILVKVLNV